MSKIKKQLTASKLVKLCDKEFSLKVRQKGADKNGLQKCYTCGYKKHWKKLHCGHFLSRFYKAARWDEDNARPQCAMCNLWRKGDAVAFRRNLLKEIGEERVRAVEEKRWQKVKLTIPFLEKVLKGLGDNVLHKSNPLGTL